MSISQLYDLPSVGTSDVGQIPELIVVSFDNRQRDRNPLGKENSASTEYTLLHAVLVISNDCVFVLQDIDSVVKTMLFVALSTATMKNIIP